MRRIRRLLIPFVPVCVFSGAVHADQATVKEVARINNCPPKKIEVYQQSMGQEGETVYRVECNMPKAVGGTAPTANALLIQCKDSLCELLRPFDEGKKEPHKKTSAAEAADAL